MIEGVSVSRLRGGLGGPVGPYNKMFRPGVEPGTFRGNSV